MKFLVRGRNVLLQEEISCHRKKLLVTGTNFMPLLKISCHRKKYPNYRYFGRLLSHLTRAVSGEIFGWKYWFPQSKIFYPTLLVPVNVLRLICCLIISNGLWVCCCWEKILVFYSARKNFYLFIVNFRARKIFLAFWIGQLLMLFMTGMSCCCPSPSLRLDDIMGGLLAGISFLSCAFNWTQR